MAIGITERGVTACGFEGEGMPRGAILPSGKAFIVETGDEDEPRGNSCELAEVPDADSAVPAGRGVVERGKFFEKESGKSARFEKCGGGGGPSETR